MGLPRLAVTFTIPLACLWGALRKSNGTFISQIGHIGIRREGGVDRAENENVDAVR